MYDIVYKPKTAIKAQALSDFVAEWTKAQPPEEIKKLEFWTIYFDGSLQLQGAGAGIVVISPQGESFNYILQLHFQASNNVAEHEALLLGLRVTTSLGIKRVKILGDSLLVINQANKEWTCNDVNMMAYCQEIRVDGSFSFLGTPGVTGSFGFFPFP